MLRNRALLVSSFLVTLVILVVGYSWPSHEVQAEWIDDCYNNHDNQSKRIDCWLRGIEDAFTVGGTEGAFDVFTTIYNRYDDFAATGCHKHAHRVGDLAFYYDYLTHEDLSKVTFPKNATAFGYGFYHGFVEHLVQNKPDPAYVDEVCPYLKDTIYDMAPAISQTFYH